MDFFVFLKKEMESGKEMKEKKYLILGIATVLITLIGVTYAYFTTKIIGDRKNVTVDMAELKIIFTNGDAIEASDVYAEDNLDIVKTFSVENKTKNDYKYNIVIEDLVNTFKTTGYLVYKITSDDGGYNMTEFKDVPKSLNPFNTGLAYNITIPAKSIHNYNVEIKYINSETVNQNADMGKTLSGKLYIEKGTNPTLSYVMLRDNPTISERTDFSVTNTETTTGTIYKTNKTEDGSDVYYYSGNTTNNWVKFGREKKASCTYNGKEVSYYDYTNNLNKRATTLTEEECLSTNVCIYNDDHNHLFYVVGGNETECTSYENYTYSSEKATYNGIIDNDIYWRIIRTNEDGSVRLLYSGLDPATTSAYIDESSFNDNYDDLKYVGYMYGTSGSLSNNRLNTNDSTIKVKIDTWYENTLLTNYDKYISKTAIYCNDRSILNDYEFGPHVRLVTNKTPTYKCGGDGNGGLIDNIQAIADKFSVSTDGGGNGQLKYPIALMTADEMNFAGGVAYSTLNSPYTWYYSNSDMLSIVDSFEWFSMSPSTGSDAFVWYNTGSRIPGYFTNGNDVTLDSVVRPALSLSSCVKIKSGIGTPDDPYVVDYEGSTC